MDQNVAHFSAGPNYGAHGLFGYVKLAPVIVAWTEPNVEVNSEFTFEDRLL